MSTHLNVLSYLLLFLCLPVFAFAQDIPEQLEHRPTPTRNTPRVVIVIDVSGSMRGSKLIEAINAAGNVAVGPVDDLLVKAITFTNMTTSLDGPEGGWFLLPYDSRLLLDSLESLSAGGETDPTDALQVGFRAEGAQAVVLITDGVFSAGVDPTPSILEEQERIQESGNRLPNFVIMGVGSDLRGRNTLAALASATGGEIWNNEGSND